ncbi:MAG: phage holin family protein [Ancrocorticia sp.]|uniref:phage holin family protein n=1 Tax=Ancrocorticia sp. TaxID=2593684 RepID=UPI003F90F4D2
MANDNPSESTKSEHTIGELISRVTEQISTLLRDEIEFTIVNLKAKVKKLGLGGVLAIVGLVLAVFAFNLLLFAGVAGFANLVPWWAAFLIVAGILLAITLLLLLIALVFFKKSQKDVVDPKGAIDQDIDTIKKGLNK